MLSFVHKFRPKAVIYYYFKVKNNSTTLVDVKQSESRRARLNFRYFFENIFLFYKIYGYISVFRHFTNYVTILIIK